jgi:hypothetical protein
VRTAGSSRGIGKDAQDLVLGYSQPSPSTSSHGSPGQAGQALRDWFAMLKPTQDLRPGLLSAKLVQISFSTPSIHFTDFKVSHCLKLCHPDWSEAEGRDLQFALMEKQNPEALRPRTLACSESETAGPSLPLRSSRDDKV